MSQDSETVAPARPLDDLPARLRFRLTEFPPRFASVAYFRRATFIRTRVAPNGDLRSWRRRAAPTEKVTARGITRIFGWAMPIAPTAICDRRVAMPIRSWRG